jgi:hypothetical protein
MPRVIELTSDAGAVYRLQEEGGRLVCDCPAFCYSRADPPRCKHAAALLGPGV